jgi:hypothetical protein
MTSKLKQARLDTITALYKDIKYPTAEQKQAVIDSLVNSNLEIDFIVNLADNIKAAQGIHHGHYR